MDLPLVVLLAVVVLALSLWVALLAVWVWALGVRLKRAAVQLRLVRAENARLRLLTRRQNAELGGVAALLESGLAGRT